MKRNPKLMIILFVLTLHGVCIASLKGKLPNQTATIVTVHGSKIQSLVPKQSVTHAKLPLECEAWNINGENVTAHRSNGKLIISGTCTNETLPLFTAKCVGLEFNFTENPYLHAVVSSKPDTQISFHLGWPGLNLSIAEEFLREHFEAVTEIDKTMGIIWISVSYSQSGEKIDDNTHHITINVTQGLAKLGLDNQSFVGLQVRQYLIGFMSLDRCYETTIESIDLLNELPYDTISTEGKGQTLQDGSTAYIIRVDNIVDCRQDCPHLQRAYILYTMDAPKDTLYTIFLLFKHDENLGAVRVSFVFIHESLLDEIGTYVDWRGPIQLDYDFEPVATLYNEMDDGDYAVIFTPLKGNKLQSVQVHKVVFTFSKLPYSAFVITNLNEEAVSIMSFFTLTIAGIIPTVLMFVLYYLHRRKALKDDKSTVRKLIIIGLFLRLVLAPISAYADDTQVFAEIGALYFGSGVLGAQWVSLPGFVYLETAAYFPYALLRTIGFQDFQFLALDVYCIESLFTKIPAILSDLCSFYFIMKIANKFSPKNKLLTSGLYLLNPLTVYLSGILGQFDPIFTFALIAYTYYLISDNDILKASLFSGFAAILNPVGFATFIPLLATIIVKKTWKSGMKSLFLIVGVLSISIIPFFFEPDSPVLLASVERLFSGVPGENFYGKQISFYTYGTDIGFLIGYGLTFRFLLEIFGFELGWLFYPFGAALAFLVFTVFFLYKIHKAHKIGSREYIYTGTFMLGVACVFQLTFPTIYEQFVVWIAGLLLISYILNEDRKIFALFILVCVSAGFIYVATWRSYLYLVSGVPVTHFGNWWLWNFGNALLGVAYSIVLVTILIITCKMWFREEYLKLRRRLKLKFAGRLKT